MPRIAPSRWFCIVITLVVAGVALTVTAFSTPRGSAGLPRAEAAVVGHAPPSRDGYFRTRGPGYWPRLQGAFVCARRVHRSTWEPRPQNAVPNHTMPSLGGVHRSLAARPVAVDNTLDRRWDRWLLPRVSGHYRGTTDEILQWAACKWGISDNVLRAVAAHESTWFQDLVYDGSGRCVPTFGCGDLITASSSATTVFCTGISRFGHDFTRDPGAGPGLCPRTFGITGVMSWQDPSWGPMLDNQNGTFPFNRRSTAFAVDYLGSQLRGCYEGWQWWLDNTGTGGYRAGDLWGCVGAWYSGDWHSAAAERYVAGVRQELADRPWLTPGWRSQGPPCDAAEGCPRGRRAGEQ
jgi:hypothetical protein